jgi:DNA-binding NarL/FixJ family response regulator
LLSKSLSSKKIKIYLADDHRILREGLKMILKTQTSFEIIGESGEGVKALEEIENLKPDLAILDISMPGMTGIEISRNILKEDRRIKVIILSRHDNEEYVKQALKYGIHGYVLKDDAGEDLLQAVESVFNGKTYLSPRISNRLVDMNHLPQRENEESLIILTNREREIVKLVAEGNSNEQIAKALHISPSTAKVHRANTMKKLGLHKAADIVKYAIKEGILES